MRVVDLIVRKRDGGRLERDDVDALVAGITSGTVPEYQTAALLMAIVFRGLDADETAWLTDAMVRSGRRVDLSRLPGAKVGKHSTGGVGDKLSLVVVPLVAACGGLVLKTSGRALGHSGGTIDKLEAIPGFQVGLPMAACLAVLGDAGCVFVGQTADLAPADKKLYALRDVTGTIESVPLIASSIMSKKIAEGAESLVLDVKVGRGAFMKSAGEARHLARAMVDIGARVGLPTRAVLTAMDAPLGRAVGNALEVIESIETLKGRGPHDVTELATVLATQMLVVSGLADDEPAAATAVASALGSGAALGKLRDVIALQGGDAGVIDDYDVFPGVATRAALSAKVDGFVTAIDAERIGRASMLLGAGRERLDSEIDYGAGILLEVRVGDRVAARQPLATLCVGRTARFEEARALAASAFLIGEAPPAPSPLVIDIVM